jgi:hypothetical protein
MCISSSFETNIIILVPDRIDLVVKRVVEGDVAVSPAVMVQAFFANPLFLARSIALITAALMQKAFKGTGKQGGNKPKVRELFFDDVFQSMIVQVKMMAGMEEPYLLPNTTFLLPGGAMQPIDEGDAVGDAPPRVWGI